MIRWLRKLLDRGPRTTRDKGARWERIAARALRRKGWRIVTRNWRGRRGELDIVAWDGPVLVFVEVRARPATALVGGYHSITAKKRQLVREAGMDYLRKLYPPPRHHRFDVVEIAHRTDKDYDVRHFEGGI